MRIFSAQHGVYSDELLLELQSLQIMRDGHEISFGWKMIGRMPPIARAKEAELLARHERLHAVLHSLEIFFAGERPIGD
jgi:hypothetical protein